MDRAGNLLSDQAHQFCGLLVYEGANQEEPSIKISPKSDNILLNKFFRFLNVTQIRVRIKILFNKKLSDFGEIFVEGSPSVSP